MKAATLLITIPLRRSKSFRSLASGFFAGNAVGLNNMGHAYENGLGVPADVSIVGVDNLELIADGLWPGLSTMALPHYEMGRWAVLKLLSELENPGAPRSHEKIPCPLVERESVASPRG